MFSVDKFNTVQTPFYYYDTQLLRKTLKTIQEESGKYPNFHVHYAVKANANPKVLRIISQHELGADCVSGGEIKAALEAGFPSDGIVYAGVGKSDWEIKLGIENDILCFNVESTAELDVIASLAKEAGKVARVAFRINPNIGAHTHANITTGLAENKFGIAMQDMVPVIEHAKTLDSIKVVGLHFHIGSQILDMGDFKALCNRINELQAQLAQNNIYVARWTAGTLRTWTCRCGTMRIAHHSPTLRKARHIQAVCHRGCRHDRLDTSCSLPGVAQDTEHQQQ